ncbi:MAG: CPBP family intramembrane metalloprotease [Clostridiales bacterium]|nr:CPBP family intramembrane metalloprotease [Clostridiales bacterium]
MESKRKLKTIISIIVAVLLGHFLVIGLTSLFAEQISSLISNAIYRDLATEAAWGVIVMINILIFKKMGIFNISLAQMGEGILTALPLLVLYANLIPLGFFLNRGTKLVSAPEIIAFLLQCLLIGLVEEGLYRGVIQELFMNMWSGSERKRAMLSIICTSVMFGLFHFFNLRKPGITVAAVMVQAASAIAMGMLLGAIFYRSGRKIWPVLILHALIDCASFITSGVLHGKTQVDAVSSLDPRSLIMIPIYIGFALFLMRKREDAKI